MRRNTTQLVFCLLLLGVIALGVNRLPLQQR